MGLDNIPFTYACQKQGTVIRDEEDHIDCKATQAANQCPWKRDLEASTLPISQADSVYGMLGTHCWYRGKEGQYMLEAACEELEILEGSTEHRIPLIEWARFAQHGFYGPDCENSIDKPDMSPNYMRELSKFMKDNVELYAKSCHRFAEAADPVDGGKTIDEVVAGGIRRWMYATWWLEWCANKCDGAKSWY